jgi:hypothetical protein
LFGAGITARGRRATLEKLAIAIIATALEGGL